MGPAALLSPAIVVAGVVGVNWRAGRWPVGWPSSTPGRQAGVVDPVSEELLATIEAVLPTWVERCVARRVVPRDGTLDPVLAEAAARAGRAAVADVVPRVRSLLDADIDAQWTTPLAILRQAVTYPTAVLAEAGVPAVGRDRFQQEAFPDDVYDLTPAKFGDVDEALADPGVAWGASKAMAHMRRHRPS